MWEDYAKSLGKSTTELTMQEKIQAEVQGIMRETVAQTGDLAKMSDTLQGAQAGTAAAAKSALTNYGEAMAPIAALSEQTKTSVLNMIGTITGAMPELTAGLTTAGTSLLGFFAIVKGFEALKSLKSVWQDLMKVPSALTGMMPALGVVSALIGVMSAVYTAKKRAEEAEVQRVKDLQNSSNEHTRNAENLKQLADRYEELSKKADKSASDMQELASIEGQIAQAVDGVGGHIDVLTGKYISLADAARQAAQAQLQSASAQQNEVYASARSAWAAATNKMNGADGTGWGSLNYAENWAEFKAKGEAAAKEALRGMQKSMQAEGKLVSQSAAQTGETVAMAMFNGLMETATTTEAQEDLLTSVQQVFSAYVGNSGEFEKALAPLSNAKQKIIAGLTLDESETTDITTTLQNLPGAIKTLFDSLGEFEGKDAAQTNFISGLYQQFSELFNLIGIRSPEALSTWLNQLDNSNTHIESAAQALQNYTTAQEASNYETAKAAAKAEALKNAGDGAFAPLTASIQEVGTHLGKFSTEINKVDKSVNNLSQSATKASAIKKYVNEFKTGKVSAEQFEKNLKSVGITTKMTADEAEKFADTLGSNTATGLNKAKEGLEAYLMELETIAANPSISTEIKADTSAAIGRVKALIAVINVLLKMMGAAGLSTGGGGGGGGGGGKKDSEYQKAIKSLEHDKKMDVVDLNAELGRLLAIRNEISMTEEEELDLEEKIHAVRKKIHEEQLKESYELIDHKKALNQISTEQEVRMLEDIAKKHWMTNQERMEYDRKLYEAQERLRQEKEEKLSGIGDGLVQALQKQYEQMHEEEAAALDKSVEAFESWADARIKAIEKQIEMLDQLSGKEDEEAKSAEELRKINRLKEAYNFEQDEYNRAQLAEQIRQAEQQREDRLRKKSLNDQKTALRDEIKALNDQKNEQRKDAEDKKKALEDTYKSLTEQVNLEAEARRMLMQKSQKDIVALIGKFAPEYDALGRSLGEKWLSGFEQSVGGVFAYFEGFTRQLQSVQSGLAQSALQAVDKYWAGRQSAVTNNTVNQTVQFNQPIETPGQAARRLKDVAEGLIYG